MTSGLEVCEPALEPGHRVTITDPVCDRVYKTRLFPVQLKTVRVISFLLGSLVLVFPSFSNKPYVTSSRRCDVIADVASYLAS